MDKRLGPLAALACAIVFYFSVISDLAGPLKFAAAVAVLGFGGLALQKIYGLEGEYGLNLLRSKKGLGLIEKIAKRKPALWNTLADFGLVIGFGASSKFFFRNLSLRTYLASLVVLAGIILLVLPSVLPVAMSVIAFPTGSLSQASRGASGEASGSMMLTGVLLVLMLGGFSTATVAGLVANAAAILYSMGKSVAGDPAALQSVSPGASFVIPGINLPLVEGILALAVLLVVHEVAHGILARVGKIRLDSAGLVFFGVLPIGAFVDPDEKQLKKQKDEKQSRVLVAGSTANFITCIAFFALLMALAFLSEGAFDREKIVVWKVTGKNNLTEGTWIQSINGTPIKSFDDYAEAKKKIGANESVLLATDRGTFTEKTDASGNIGVFLTNGIRPGWGWIFFFYNFFALTFVLNFLIGSVNLLPVPMFDGYRLAKIALKNEALLKAIGMGVALSFLVNFLPWFWH